MWQVARVLKGGGAYEADFEVVWEGNDLVECELVARQEVRKMFPGA
jgi:hypothetical protein